MYHRRHHREALLSRIINCLYGAASVLGVVNFVAGGCSADVLAG